MLRNLRQPLGGFGVFGVPTVGILASQILAETSLGENGPGILENEAASGLYTAQFLGAVLLTPPAVGTVAIDENGAFVAEGLPDGRHVFTYEFFVDNASQGTADFIITVGVTSSCTFTWAPSTTFALTLENTISIPSICSANVTLGSVFEVLGGVSACSLVISPGSTFEIQLSVPHSWVKQGTLNSTIWIEQEKL